MQDATASGAVVTPPRRQSILGNIRDLGGQPFDNGKICWIPTQHIPKKRDKWGGVKWECFCKKCQDAGRETVATISAHQLTHLTLPPCPICGPRLRSIAEIEVANPGYKCQDNSGYPRATINSWHNVEGLLVKVQAPELGAPINSPVQTDIGLASGGGLEARTYHWVVTALHAGGETVKSNEKSLAINGENKSARLTWGAVSNATGYKIYRSTTDGGYGPSSLVATINNPTTTSYIDPGAATMPGTPPVAYYFEEKTANYFRQAMKFYDVAALAEIEKRQTAERVRKRWTVNEIIKKFGKEWVRDRYVRRVLGMEKQTFRLCKKKWNEEGNRWPILNAGHDRPETIEHKGHTYFWKEQVDTEMVLNLAKLPKKIPDDDPDHHLFSLDRSATELKVGSCVSWTKGKKRRRRCNLEEELFWIRYDTQRYGETIPILRSIVGLTRESVRRFRVRLEMCELPKLVMSLQDAVSRLRNAKKCFITNNTVRKWCEEGLLDAVRTDFLTTTGIRNGWVMTEESYIAAKDALRDCGWDSEAAKLKLRHRRDERGRDSLPSLARQRIEAHQEKVEQAQHQAPTDTNPATAPSPGRNHVEDSKVYPSLGIEVDFRKKKVKAAEKTREFGRSEVWWHILIVALFAHPNAYTLDEVKTGYPVAWDPDSYKTAKSNLNAKLKGIGLRIDENRRLIVIGKTSG